MARGLDHIVHAVRDLDAAAEGYRRLGFTVGARNRHPWGTHNHVVQFPGFFIEILTVAEPDKLGEDGFSKLFGDFNRHFLDHAEGLAMLLLESRDAKADAVAFRSASIAISEAMRFEREGRRPDGSPVKVAFSLAFARDPLAPAIGLAVCQQHYPDNFWNAAFQSHANGVSGVLGAVMVATDPAAHVDAIAAFAGADATKSSAEEIAFATPRGEIAILTPELFRDRFGIAAPDVSQGARLAALRLADNGTMASGAKDIFGAVLVFEAAEPRRS